MTGARADAKPPARRPRTAAGAQALRLSAWLSEGVGTEVKIVHYGGRVWAVRWVDGPTQETVEGLIAVAFDSGGYPDLAGHELRPGRLFTPQAWVARAVAAHRVGVLAPEIDDMSWWPNFPLPGIGEVVEFRVGHILAESAYPERPDRVEDRPVIDELAFTDHYRTFTDRVRSAEGWEPFREFLSSRPSV